MATEYARDALIRAPKHAVKAFPRLVPKGGSSVRAQHNEANIGLRNRQIKAGSAGPDVAMLALAADSGGPAPGADTGAEGVQNPGRIMGLFGAVREETHDLDIVV